jgi:uncharacterized protein (TIGR02996 family)
VSHERALLAAICADPADDTPRLAYADFLEEQARENPTNPCPRCHLGWKKGFGTVFAEVCDACEGSGTVPDTSLADRAEFIRVQVELARLPPETPARAGSEMPLAAAVYAELRAALDPHHDRRDELRRRERELLRHLDDWYPPVCKTFGRYDWERGFISAVTCTCADFLAHAAAVFACHPVERVTLANKEPAASLQHRGWFRWYTDSDEDESVIPQGVYRKLIGVYPEDLHGKSSQPYWKSRELALEALSDACVAWGREQAKSAPVRAGT